MSMVSAGSCRKNQVNLEYEGFAVQELQERNAASLYLFPEKLIVPLGKKSAAGNQWWIWRAENIP